MTFVMFYHGSDTARRSLQNVIPGIMIMILGHQDIVHLGVSDTQRMCQADCGYNKSSAIVVVPITGSLCWTRLCSA